MNFSSNVKTRAAATLLLGALWLPAAAQTTSAARGWTEWRGPNQNGTSPEKGLPNEIKPDGKNLRWSYKLAGRGAPVIANGRVYAIGYDGTGPDLQEVLLCVDAETGAKVWEKRFNDYLSDTAYDRYAIGSPTVDRETGNIYVLTTAGLFSCFTPEGNLVWQHALMEQYGRLTFPNGRMGSPTIDDDLVIIHGILSNWGAQGAAADRFQAFDKRTGALIWTSTPGTMPPKDNSFSTPVFAWQNGQRVFYSGTGCGHIVCVNARTGQPIWKYRISAGGVNASPVLAGDRVIVIQGDENVDSSEMGRMVAVKIGAQPAAGSTEPVVLDNKSEFWRNRLNAWSSSPVLVGNRVYQTVKTGELACVDVNTGAIIWEQKLAPDQLHASPLYADGKLYITFQNGTVAIVKPGEKSAQVLSSAQFPGYGLGAPIAWNGKIYFFTTENLYCFGAPGKKNFVLPVAAPQKRPTPGPIAQVQAVPSEVLLRPGQKVKITLRGLDANGNFVRNVSGASWAKYIPATAKVRAEADANFVGDEIGAAEGAKTTAGAFQATVTVDGKEIKGEMRARVLPNLPLREDFESFALTEDLVAEGVKFSYPPLPWIGARFKWEIRDLEGNKVLTKTLDNIFFQRATGFIGTPDMKNYTVESDVMSEGNRRNMSIVGLVNQRYNISLIGNAQVLEVSSTADRIKVSVPFKWLANTWYRMKTRVDVAPDGSGVVRAKAWKKGDAEPEAWTIEVPHKQAHTNGSPGLFSFALQSQFRTFHDNVAVTPN